MRRNWMCRARCPTRTIISDSKRTARYPPRRCRGVVSIRFPKARRRSKSRSLPAATIGPSFTIGRVRVIMTDVHSAADPRAAPDTAAKTHLGEAQKAWFKQELIAARDADFPLILWISTNPWIGAAGSGDDDWSVYSN